MYPSLPRSTKIAILHAVTALPMCAGFYYSILISSLDLSIAFQTVIVIETSYTVIFK